MTINASEQAAIPIEIWDALLTSFAARVSPKAVSMNVRAAPTTGDVQEPPEIQWLEAAAKALNRLPYNETILPDGRIALKPEAAAELLWTLLNALEDDTIAPTAIIPTSKGGVATEWHVGEIDLEIECDPGGAIEYNFAGPGDEEYEGPADPDLSRIKRHVAMLPKQAR